MRTRPFVLSVVLVAAGAGAEGAALQIAHTPKPCVLGGQFARIEARVEPASDAVQARVLFRRDGEAQFHEVPMRREGELFVGILPSPASGTARIAYFISAELGGSHARAPVSSAFLADVVRTPCAEGAFAVSAQGPAEVRVPPGAPQAPPGFERRGIAAFVEAEAGPTVPASQPSAAALAPLAALPIAPGSRVRVVTRPGNQPREGRLTGFDGESLSLDTGETPVRIRRADMVSLEVREPGSTGMRVLGGLGGAVAGLAVVALICASGDDCDSVAIAWAGLGVGAVAGAALTGHGSWKPVTLASAGPVALDLRSRPSGAGLELRLGF